MVLRLSLFLVLLCSSAVSLAAEKIVLVTLDGLRWQELFTGIDESLLNSEEFTKSEDSLRKDYWDDFQREERPNLCRSCTARFLNKERSLAICATAPAPR